MYSELVCQIFDKFDLDKKKVLDTCLALSIESHLLGDGISIQVFSTYCDEDWCKWLNLLGVTPRKAEKRIPKTVQNRIICDSIILNMDSVPDDITLTSEAGGKVASVMGKRLHGHENLTVEECESILRSLLRNSVSLDGFKNLESKVDELGIGDDAKEAWKSLKVPSYDLKYIGYTSKLEGVNSEDDLLQMAEELLMLHMESKFLRKLRSALKVNNVYANYKFTEAISGNNTIFGTRSMDNSVPRLEVRDDFPGYIRTKLNRIFCQDMNYNINNLTNITELIKAID